MGLGVFYAKISIWTYNFWLNFFLNKHKINPVNVFSPNTLMSQKELSGRIGGFAWDGAQESTLWKEAFECNKYKGYLPIFQGCTIRNMFYKLTKSRNPKTFFSCIFPNIFQRLILSWSISIYFYSNFALQNLSRIFLD